MPSNEWTSVRRVKDGVIVQVTLQEGNIVVRWPVRTVSNRIEEAEEESRTMATKVMAGLLARQRGRAA